MKTFIGLIAGVFLLAAIGLFVGVMLLGMGATVQQQTAYLVGSVAAGVIAIAVSLGGMDVSGAVNEIADEVRAIRKK